MLWAATRLETHNIAVMGRNVQFEQVAGGSSSLNNICIHTIENISCAHDARWQPHLSANIHTVCMANCSWNTKRSFYVFFFLLSRVFFVLPFDSHSSRCECWCCLYPHCSNKTDHNVCVCLLAKWYVAVIDIYTDRWSNANVCGHLFRIDGQINCAGLNYVLLFMYLNVFFSMFIAFRMEGIR